MDRIDFVVPWVDGSDPYVPEGKTISEAQYRDWDIFKYWFRAVETYAPWVNRIYLITCGQWPEWLNRSHSKLRCVDHRDYIPEEYLPTFSSHTIELNLHRIEGLSEHFVYFNDDMFLNAPVQPEDFFGRASPAKAQFCHSWHHR